MCALSRPIPHPAAGRPSTAHFGERQTKRRGPAAVRKESDRLPLTLWGAVHPKLGSQEVPPSFAENPTAPLHPFAKVANLKIKMKL